MKPRQSLHSLHSLPRPAAVTSLAATTKLKQPVASYLVHETVDAMAVARDGMIIQPALYHTPQPATRFAQRAMSSLSQFCFDLPQLGTYTFGHRMAMNRAPALLASLGTLVREAKEIESFRPALLFSFCFALWRVCIWGSDWDVRVLLQTRLILQHELHERVLQRSDIRLNRLALFTGVAGQINNFWYG